MGNYTGKNTDAAVKILTSEYFLSPQRVGPLWFTELFAMHQIFHPSILHDVSMCCNKCGWDGTYKEVHTEHMFLTDAMELYCPRCENYIGFVNESAEDPS